MMTIITVIKVMFTAENYHEASYTFMLFILNECYFSLLGRLQHVNAYMCGFINKVYVTKC